MGVQPERVAKLSGIGCSSKSPAYFMNRSHSFNSVHGRMPSVATGAMLANRNLIALGVSGDGDTASIGIGQFVHLMRRNLPLIYIIEDNGVYGLTKGQFSATADLGSKLKSGVINDLPPIDTCGLAIELGATFVGRSFSGDKRQLSAMLKAAIAHHGTVMLDVVSPCVTFNDHEGSTKSYKYVKDHEEDFAGNQLRAALRRNRRGVRSGNDGQRHHARWLPSAAAQAGRRLRPDRPDRCHDPALSEAHDKGEVLTGLFYVNTKSPSFLDMLNMVDEPLATLPESVTRPGREALAAAMEELGKAAFGPGFRFGKSYFGAVGLAGSSPRPAP